VAVRIRRIVDLSVPIDDATQVYPGDPVPRLVRHADVAHDGYNLLQVELGSQTGTHVDAPYHVTEDGLRLSDLDLRLFAGPAVLVDVRGLPARTRITWDRIAPQTAGLGPGVIVLLHTGWSAHVGSAAYFDHPFLDPGACRRLLDLGVRTFCLDAPSIDATPHDGHPGDGLPVHRLIAAAGGVIGENFRNLDRIDFPDPFVCCFPIALAGADGAPVRAVAIDGG
jgi:kynurenine formamidase